MQSIEQVLEVIVNSTILPMGTTLEEGEGGGVNATQVGGGGIGSKSRLVGAF